MKIDRMRAVEKKKPVEMMKKDSGDRRYRDEEVLAVGNVTKRRKIDSIQSDDLACTSITRRSVSRVGEGRKDVLDRTHTTLNSMVGGGDEANGLAHTSTTLRNHKSWIFVSTMQHHGLTTDESIPEYSSMKAHTVDKKKEDNTAVEAWKNILRKKKSGSCATQKERKEKKRKSRETDKKMVDSREKKMLLNWCSKKDNSVDVKFMKNELPACNKLSLQCYRYYKIATKPDM